MRSELKERATRGVFLVGFMGSGKTTVGEHLARLLGRPFYDLDGRVEAAAGRSIAEIFEQEGEPAFRALESRILAELLAEMEASPGAVIALGGGTFVQPANRGLLEKGLSVFLECPLEEMIRRCSGLASSSEKPALASPAHRPLFRDPEAFRRLYEERLPSYRLADLTVPSDTGTPEEVAESIAKLIP